MTTIFERTALWTAVLPACEADPTLVPDGIAWVKARGSKVDRRTTQLLALTGTPTAKAEAPKAKAKAAPKAPNAIVAWATEQVRLAGGNPRYKRTQQARLTLDTLTYIRTSGKVREHRGEGLQDAIKGCYRLTHVKVLAFPDTSYVRIQGIEHDMLLPEDLPVRINYVDTWEDYNS
jgi:hypothetical protein